MKYFLVFCFFWWILFFIILPIGIVQDHKVQRGFALGTPKNPKILLKFVLTTVISLFFILVVFYAAYVGIIDKNIFR